MFNLYLSDLHRNPGGLSQPLVRLISHVHYQQFGNELSLGLWGSWTEMLYRDRGIISSSEPLLYSQQYCMQMGTLASKCVPVYFPNTVEFSFPTSLILHDSLVGRLHNSSSMNTSRALQFFPPWLMLSQAELWTHCCSSKPNQRKYGVYWWPIITPGITFCLHEGYAPALCGLTSGSFLRCLGAALPMAALSMPVEHTQNALCLVGFPDSSLQEKDFIINLHWDWHAEVKYLPHIPTTAYHSACSCTFYLGFGET